MHRHRPPRGFTLIELLVTVTVIGIIVAMAMGALMKAQDTAREQRTRGLIAKLHTQMMYRWESYQTRRLPIRSRDFANGETPKDYAARRMWAQRELMRFELPQRWADVVEDVDQFPATGVTSAIYPVDNWPLLNEVPALSESYLRRYNDNAINGIAAQPSADFESAECLYLVLTMGHDDGLGTQRFRAADVGDVDQDGAREFIDGWGRPISFIRWAPGYLPLSALPSANSKDFAVTDLHTGDPENDHDPFDPLRIDVPTGTEPYRGMRLVPLIYSSGPDGESDIWNRNANADLNDPYFLPAAGQGLLAGTPMTAENTQGLPTQGEGRHMDNLTNHALGVR